MYFLPTILPCSGRYSGQRVHESVQILKIYTPIRYILTWFTNTSDVTNSLKCFRYKLCFDNTLIPYQFIWDIIVKKASKNDLALGNDILWI
jgi:hypothetical protein